MVVEEKLMYSSYHAAESCSNTVFGRGCLSFSEQLVLDASWIICN